jgi:hypothetical protein
MRDRPILKGAKYPELLFGSETRFPVYPSQSDAFPQESEESSAASRNCRDSGNIQGGHKRSSGHGASSRPDASPTGSRSAVSRGSGNQVLGRAGRAVLLRGFPLAGSLSRFGIVCDKTIAIHHEYLCAATSGFEFCTRSPFSPFVRHTPGRSHYIVGQQRRQRSIKL